MNGRVLNPPKELQAFLYMEYFGVDWDAYCKTPLWVVRTQFDIIAAKSRAEETKQREEERKAKRKGRRGTV